MSAIDYSSHDNTFLVRLVLDYICVDFMRHQPQQAYRLSLAACRATVFACRVSAVSSSVVVFFLSIICRIIFCSNIPVNLTSLELCTLSLKPNVAGYQARCFE